ncbi:MAG: hypothetical protein SV253_09145 [Halobacteria archaeon]|nr:hypothetical protein [Halobacteria archaeon]
MECPYCDLEAIRMRVHRHLLEEHDFLSERAGDDGGGYEFDCPDCGETAVIEPGGLGGEEEAQKFDNEMRMMAVDRLLNHLQEEHG